MIGFVLYFTFGVSRVGAAILIVSGNHPAIELGVVMAMYALAPLVMAIHAGAAATRFGPRWMVIGGGAMLLCGAALQGMPGGSYALLFPGAVLCGIGFTALQIALQLHIGERSAPEARVRNFGYFSLTQSAATSLAAMLGGYLSGTWGEHAPLQVAAIAAVGLVSLVVTNRHAFRASTAAVARATEGPDRAIVRLIGQRDVRNVLVAGALLAMAWDLHTFIVPFISSSVRLSPEQIGVVLGLFSGATFVIRLCLPGLVRRVSSMGMIRAALIVVGLCFVAYPWRTSYATMCVLAGFLGLALGTAQPNLLALVHEVAAERDVGRVIGLRTILLNIGSSLWPLCFSALGSPVVGFVLPSVGMVFVLAGTYFSLTPSNNDSNR